MELITAPIDTLADASPFNELTQCYVSAIRYDYITRSGIIEAPTGSVDMNGAIELFKRIDPDVVHVTAFLAGMADSSYRNVNGNWIYIDLRGAPRAA